MIGAKHFHEAMKIGSEIYHHLKNVIKSKYGLDACNVGDEGGFAPNIQDSMEGLDLIVIAIEKAGYTGKVKIGMDIAASEFYQDGKYNLDFKSNQSNPSLIVSIKFLLIVIVKTTNAQLRRSFRENTDSSTNNTSLNCCKQRNYV